MKIKTRLKHASEAVRRAVKRENRKAARRAAKHAIRRGEEPAKQLAAGFNG